MIVSTEQLTKTYGATTALESVDLSVPEHCVYGLVGLNGAGKTTLLSILGGLRRASSGTVHVDAAPGEWALCPDTPVFEPWLNAREVLHLAASLAGSPATDGRVDALLDDAGLADAGDRRVGGFSRGMTQRLAVAATMVSRPRVVFLDEPCSALDPAGRVEVLDLVRRSRADATVVFSSHVLADVQRVCDLVGVLDHGRLVFQGRVADLLEEHARPVWRFGVRTNADALARALGAHEWAEDVVAVDDQTVLVHVGSPDVAEREVAAVIAGVGVRLTSFQPEVPDLETVFLRLTAGARRGPASAA